MAILALKVLDKDSNTICVSSGEDFVDLVCTHTYEEGDRIVLETDEKNIHVHLQVDDALGDAFVYYIYQKAFIDWDLGYSSSVAMVLFLMVLFVTIIQFRGQAKREKA